MDKLGKWRGGASYGPILSQTDLYLLRCELELHPILVGKNAAFHLVFSLVTGQATGFNQDARDRDLPFSQKDEPATVPRVKQLIIITEHTPWCTVVTNENGVTLNDICVQMYRDYTNTITSAEFTSLPPRVQDQIKRSSAHNIQNSNAAAGGWPNGGGYYPPTPIAPVSSDQLKRYDWLRDRVFFEAMRKDDAYAVSRLGFKAPNIFVLDLSG
ncbi:hypothetical protein DXG01_016632 [Tephrocybe rancida]|nr:hypothetical protein DXG01_016632 [Tephrocybe rancida]